MLPVLHEAAELAPSEKLLPPDDFEAKVESFFLICELPQEGQVTSLMALLLRSSSSKGWLHSEQTNSNKGIQVLHFRVLGN